MFNNTMINQVVDNLEKEIINIDIALQDLNSGDKTHAKTILTMYKLQKLGTIKKVKGDK